MKNILKFENGKLVLNTEGLRTKQQRNMIKLISAGEVTGALTYAATLQGPNRHKYTRIDHLSQYRYDLKSSKEVFKKNRVWNMFALQFNTGNEKTPSKLLIPEGKAIGVEIEFFMPRGDFHDDEACGDCDYCNDDNPDDCENRVGGTTAARRHFTDLCAKHRIKGVMIGEDGSIQCDDELYIPLEARILTRIDDLSNLEAFLKVLNDAGAAVNKSCGLHVHLDMRDYERRPAAVVAKLAAALPILKAMVPKSRLGNRYCEHDLGSESGYSGHDSRYACINDLQAFSKFKTVEVRLHSGTVNYTKIANWIKVLYSIARSEGKPTANTLEAYAAKYNWSASLVAYIVTRIRKFNPSHELLGDGKELGNGDTLQLTIDTAYEESEAA